MACAHAGGPVRHLEDLRLDLAGRGWTTSLQEPPGRPPGLFVQNPDPAAAVLCEHVLAAPASDGTAGSVGRGPAVSPRPTRSPTPSTASLTSCAPPRTAPSGCDWPERHRAPDAGAGSNVAASTLMPQAHRPLVAAGKAAPPAGSGRRLHGREQSGQTSSGALPMERDLIRHHWPCRTRAVSAGLARDGSAWEACGSAAEPHGFR